MLGLIMSMFIVISEQKLVTNEYMNVSSYWFTRESIWPFFYGNDTIMYERVPNEPSFCSQRIKQDINLTITLFLGETCPVSYLQSNCVNIVMEAFFEPKYSIPLTCGLGKNDDCSDLITIRHDLQSHFSPLHWKFELIGHPGCAILSDNLKLRLNQIIECEEAVLFTNRYMMIPISIMLLIGIIIISGFIYCVGDQFYQFAIGIIAAAPMT